MSCRPLRAIWTCRLMPLSRLSLALPYDTEKFKSLPKRVTANDAILSFNDSQDCPYERVATVKAFALVSPLNFGLKSNNKKCG